jgi:ubiquinone/menaquinone biosynthesis C-methylase UbiE
VTDFLSFREDPSPESDPDAVLEIFLGFWISRTVMAAVEMGVFETLEGRTLDAAEAGAALGGLADRPARALLDTCVAAKLLDKADGRYTNSPLASRFLHAGSEYSLRNYVLDERWCWGAWGRLEDALRADAQQLPPDEEGYHAFPADFFYDFLHGHSLAMGERLAGAVDLTGVGRIMDVGGGSGAVSIALCRRFPDLEAVVVDQGPVAARAAEHVERAGLSGRITTHPANLFADPLPADCDAAVVANLLHDFSPGRCGEILARVAGALPSGGRLVVMEIVPDDERTGPPLAVAFAAAMVVNTAGGDAHTAARYREWLAEAGFADIREHRLPGRMVTTAFEAIRR